MDKGGDFLGLFLVPGCHSPVMLHLRPEAFDPVSVLVSRPIGLSRRLRIRPAWHHGLTALVFHCGHDCWGVVPFVRDSAAVQLLICLASGAVRFFWLPLRRGELESWSNRGSATPHRGLATLQTPRSRRPSAPSGRTASKRSPVAETLGQATPRDTSSSNPKHGIEEQAVAFAHLARFPRANGKKRLDANPIGIRNRVAGQHGTPSLAGAESRP